MTSFGRNAGCASKPVVGYGSIAAPLLPAGQGEHVGLRQAPPVQPLPPIAPELPLPEPLVLPELAAAPGPLLLPELLVAPEPLLLPEVLAAEPLLLPEAPFAVPEPLLVLPVLLAVPPPPPSSPADDDGAGMFDAQCASSARAARHEGTMGFMAKTYTNGGTDPSSSSDEAIGGASADEVGAAFAASAWNWRVRGGTWARYASQGAVRARHANPPTSGESAARRYAAA